MSAIFQPINQTTKAEATYVLPNDTTEHDLIEITNTTNKIQSFSFHADISEITKNNFKLRLYVKIDNTNYQLHNTFTFSAAENVVEFENFYTSFSIKVTAQSNILEGATRNIPYIYYLEPH